MPVKRRNPTVWRDLEARLKRLPGKKLAVGYPANSEGVANPHYPDGLSIIQVAMINNYGLGVPRRDFFEQAREPIQKLGAKALKEALPKLNQGSVDYVKLLDLIGLQAEAEVRKSIRDGNWTPNAPATVKQKGSDKPLIDTGAMLQGVTHVVR